MSKENIKKQSIWELAKQENEAKLIREQDFFFYNSTPKWFEFVEMLFLLGGLDYLAEQTKHLFIDIVSAASYFFLYFYLQSVLCNFPFYRFLPTKLIKGDKFAYRFSGIVGGILLLIVYLSLNSIISLFSNQTIAG